MFEGLKKKFTSFIDSISKKEAEKQQEQQPEPAAEEAQVKGEQEPAIEEPKPVHHIEAKAPGQPVVHQHHKEEDKPKDAYIAPQQEERPKEVHIAKAPEQDRKPEVHIAKVPEQKTEAKPAQVHHPTAQAPAHPSPKPVQPVESRAPEPKIEKAAYHEPAPAPVQEERKELPRPSVQEHAPKKEPKISFTTKIKGFVFGSVKISEKDAEPFIEDLKMGLLQSDVNYDVSEKITDSIRTGLVGKQINSRSIEAEIRHAIHDSIMNVLTRGSGIDLAADIRRKSAAGELPYKIMFIGPNGAGKTTTMAKIAHMLLSSNITCVMSASDTFRAAAIEQTVHHASKLGINVIKGNYGSDPASVAFDAIAHAKAHGIMAVLIDSAGRQETNKSLIEELKKMVRIAKPDLKVFVGESISGNALLDQVKALNEAVGLDGIILTKLDCDAKGGNTLSILGDTPIPILFFGTGEKYTDIMPYDAGFIADNIIPNN